MASATAEIITKSKMSYFSEREKGEAPREKEEINKNAWRGIRTLIITGIKDGSFGERYPKTCRDGTAVIGTDAQAFSNAMQAEIPSLPEYPWKNKTPDDLSTLKILDMIEFCWQAIGKPVQKEYHDFAQQYKLYLLSREESKLSNIAIIPPPRRHEDFGAHHHLEFNVRDGRQEFREEIEIIFRRNGIAYELTEKGRIERLVPPIFCEALVEAHFNTGDQQLDDLLRTAQEEFIDPARDTRREALEPLWDAWERLKTLDGHGDKRSRVKAMLDAAAGSRSPRFREALEGEARALTDIGNALTIRHSETNQEQLAKSEHVDYLFYRLYSLIHLILRLR